MRLFIRTRTTTWTAHKGVEANVWQAPQTIPMSAPLNGRRGNGGPPLKGMISGRTPRG